MARSKSVALLDDVDALPYPRRMAVLAERARSMKPAALDKVLAELAPGDHYQRAVALFLATVAGRSDHLASAVADPDARNKAMATVAWLRTAEATPERVAGVLGDAPAALRAVIYRGVRRAAREDLADALVEDVRIRFGDREAAALLVACGQSTVERLLPGLWPAGAGLTAVGYRHPTLALAEAARQLAASSRPQREAWWQRYTGTVFAARLTQPRAVLDLVERYAPPASLPGWLTEYGPLADVDPHRLLRLLTAPGRRRWLTYTVVPRALLERLVRVGPADLVDLARCVRENEVSLARLLKAVAPRDRADLFDAAHTDVDRRHARPGDRLLDVLPHARRIAEIRRVLALPDVAQDEGQTLRYTAHLGWPEAEPMLSAACRRNLADDRAAGYELLIACAARTRDPAVLTDVINRLVRLRNEQDPVRARALAALARVRGPLLEPDAAPSLTQLVTDAVQARDTSTVTLNALSTLTANVLRHHTGQPALLAFARHALDKLYGGNRLPYLGRLDTELRHGQEREFFAAVRSWLEAANARGEYGPLFALTQALHRRAWRLDELQAMLAQGVGAGNTAGAARQAIDLWLADPAHRAHRVVHVLAEDESAAVLPRVWHTLCVSRTDLLDRVLSRKPLRGRFIARDVRWVPLHAPSVARWLPRQHEAYAELLARHAKDKRSGVHNRAAAIASAARVPTYGLPVVRQYLDAGSVNLAEAALSALAWTERPDEALPILLSHVDDDRARVAVYAAGRAARYVAPSRLREALAAALGNGKITSRKEALRLFSRLSVPGAGDVLTAAWNEEGQHRDVRAAIVATARQRLHDPLSWPILEAADARAELLAVLDADPYRMAEPDRRRYAALVARASQSDDNEVSVAAWSVLPDWAQWTDDLAGTVVARLVDLSDRTVWTRVVPALVRLVDAGRAGSAAADAARRLAREDDAVAVDEDRDRPAHRRVVAMVNQLVVWSGPAPADADRSALVELAGVLAARSETVPLAALLLVHGAPLDSPQEMVDGLAAAADALADRPLAAQAAAESLRSRIAHAPDVRTVARDAAELLAARDDRTSGLFALAMLRDGDRLGWPLPWRDVVLRLRLHPVADVRAAALDVVLD